MLTLKEARKLGPLPGQPIQWHLPTTAHDKCPHCGGRLAYMGRTRRACMGTCTGGLTWELAVSMEFFLETAGVDRDVSTVASARRCRRCNRPGHNARTCRVPKAS
jgi:hypothetical protein